MDRLADGRGDRGREQEPGDARICLAGMHHLRRPELPDPEGDPGRRAARAEEVLPARAEAHAAQGIAEEVIADRPVDPATAASPAGRPMVGSSSERGRSTRTGRPVGRAGDPGRYERSSIGRAPVSKTGGWGFDSLRSCSRGGRAPADGAGPDVRASGSRDRATARTGRRVPAASETGAMGKVKDGVPASKAPKPAKGKPRRSRRAVFAQFLANLVRADLYKPMQGWYARLYTAVGAGGDRGAGRLAALRDALRVLARSRGSASRRPSAVGPGLDHLPARAVSRRSSSS